MLNVWGMVGRRSKRPERKKVAAGVGILRPVWNDSGSCVLPLWELVGRKQALNPSYPMGGRKERGREARGGGMGLQGLGERG